MSRAQDMNPGDLVFTSGTYFSPHMRRHARDMCMCWFGWGRERRLWCPLAQGNESPGVPNLPVCLLVLWKRALSLQIHRDVAVSHCNDRRWSGPSDRRNGKSNFSFGHLAQQKVMSSAGWVEPGGHGEAKVCGTQEELGFEAMQSNSEKTQGARENLHSGDYSASNAAYVTPERSNARHERQEAKENRVAEEKSSPRKRRSAPEQKGPQEMQAEGGGTVHGPVPGGEALERTQKCEQRERDRRAEEPMGPGPFFFVGGGNGASIVASYCESQGWQRIYDKTRDDYKLKWCETKSRIAFYNFREGEQLLYQIPNNKVLTTKVGLLSSLREYDRVSSKVNHGRGLRRLKMEEFFPDTFRMDIRDEKDAFFAQHKVACGDRTEAWICKPTGLNQGRGIFLLRTEEEISAFRAQLQAIDDNQNYKRLPFRLPQARIVQRYVQNPLLLEGRKFDVRSYFLIACTTPYMVFFRHGYVRLTCDLYDPNSNNLTAHLTNQYMQKKSPLYSELKEETVWSMERFNAYVNEQLREARGLPQDWVLGAFAKRMQVIITQCFLAVKAKLECKLGLFDLIGCDFMIDEDFKVWLLEMNCNPALHTNCRVLKEVVPSTVTETLDLTLEIFSKCRSGLKLLPLASQRDFILLYGGDQSPEHRNRRAVPLSTPRTWPSLPKPARRRVELRVSRCTWEPPWGDAEPRPLPAARRGNIASLSTPALTGGPRFSVHRARNRPSPSPMDPCLSSCLRPTRLRPSQGRPSTPVWVDDAEERRDTEAGTKE
ncbi:hypothetical protein AAFF_G00036180 [Aldrovandia affinis]|uniref:Inactive polyglycylase TTLL10 n=1 Tax=Aldrovandia affinis TaxID=143900 RepID=A0AAD7S380_9TELE|nr:hypothetical protein AAFF_G00036180 [Aldrovandia affinis]